MQIDIDKAEQEIRDTIGAYYINALDRHDYSTTERNILLDSKDLELSWLTELVKLAKIGQTVKEVSEHYRSLG